MRWLLHALVDDCRAVEAMALQGELREKHSGGVESSASSRSIAGTKPCDKV